MQLRKITNLSPTTPLPTKQREEKEGAWNTCTAGVKNKHGAQIKPDRIYQHGQKMEYYHIAQ